MRFPTELKFIARFKKKDVMMKNKTVTVHSADPLATNRGIKIIFAAALVMFWSLPVFCQEFSAIIKEINGLESKLTRIIQNEAAQRKASDSAIVKSIGKTTVLQSPSHDDERDRACS